MGIYTELIFGASLKRDTPKQVIDALKYITGQIEDKPKDFPLPEGRCEWLLGGGSGYFPCHTKQFFKEEYSDCWTLNTRSNIKNYNNEIETFLNWIEPYVQYASGVNNMYAIVIYEESETPTIYYATKNI